MSAVILAFPARSACSRGAATANLIGIAERELPLLHIAGDLLDRTKPALAAHVRRLIAAGDLDLLLETEHELTIGADAYALIAEAVSTARDRLREALAHTTGPPAPAA